MEAAQRPATVRVVSAASEEGAAQGPVGHPGPRGPINQDPNAAPPITTASAPGDEEATRPDLGGPVMPEIRPEDMVGAAGGGLADRLRARYNSIAATEEFPVPGWELPDGSPGLIVVARTFGDRKAFQDGIEHEVFIARSTYKLLYVNDDGSREEIPGGWGPQLAEMIGARAEKAADLIRLVISKPDPDDELKRIPNVAGIAALAQLILEWAGRGQRQAEEDLGE